jgi:hypothetical protein
MPARKEIIMKEEEAKTKYCPFAKPVFSDGTCAASKCMMWVWFFSDKSLKSVHSLIEYSTTDGRCGLIKA